MLWVCVKYFVHDYISKIIKIAVAKPCNHNLLVLRLFILFVSLLGKPGTCEKYGRFQCNNGKCIYNGNICDFRNDCGDNSDESKTDGAFCGRCAWLAFCGPSKIVCSSRKIISVKITRLEYSFKCNRLLKIISSGKLGKKSDKRVKSYHISFKSISKLRKGFNANST